MNRINYETVEPYLHLPVEIKTMIFKYIIGNARKEFSDTKYHKLRRYFDDYIILCRKISRNIWNEDYTIVLYKPFGCIYYTWNLWHIKLYQITRKHIAVIYKNY